MKNPMAKTARAMVKERTTLRTVKKSTSFLIDDWATKPPPLVSAIE
jgi:hypothetical protein